MKASATLSPPSREELPGGRRGSFNIAGGAPPAPVEGILSPDEKEKYKQIFLVSTIYATSPPRLRCNNLPEF